MPLCAFRQSDESPGVFPILVHTSLLWRKHGSKKGVELQGFFLIRCRGKFRHFVQPAKLHNLNLFKFHVGLSKCQSDVEYRRGFLAQKPSLYCLLMNVNELEAVETPCINQHVFPSVGLSPVHIKILFSVSPHSHWQEYRWYVNA